MYAFRVGMQKFGIKPSFRIESVVRLYARWIREGRLRPSSAWNRERRIRFTVQDPCQLVRKGYGDAAAEDLRFTLAACVGPDNVADMWPNRSANYCCGGGGGFRGPMGAANLGGGGGGVFRHAGGPAARRAFGRVKHEQILTTGAPYVVTPCHNCHSQIHDLSEQYGGGYRAVHLWTLLALSLGVLGVNERTYLGPDLADAVL